ncbi:MAG: MerC family mercury resistance protein, partial [Gemmatimonadota bacterium]
MALLPGMVAAFLPAVSCPACWPAYMGLLSGLGIGFLSDADNLRLVTVGLLGAALLAMADGARRRQRYGPLLLAAGGSVAMVLAKFLFQAPLIAHAAVVIIVAASIWNALPRKSYGGSCPSCKPTGSDSSS